MSAFSGKGVTIRGGCGEDGPAIELLFEEPHRTISIALPLGDARTLAVRIYEAVLAVEQHVAKEHVA